MPSKLLIIQPSYYRLPGDRNPVRLRHRQLVPLVLPYLAALTPPDWEVTLVDEILEPVDLAAPVDVVAITTWTMNSHRTYDLAREFRRRGRKVLMGGPHAYWHFEEAQEHADAVGVGEAEALWRTMLADAAGGRLRPLYRAPQLQDLGGFPFPRYDLLDLRRYGLIKTFAVQATRGCPLACEFCSERLYLGGGFRVRPVQDVVEEIKRLPSRNVFFAESNFGVKRRHAMELMEALIPLRLRWSTLWSMNLCYDKEFLDLAQRSGLLHVNIGMESIDGQTIASMRKRQNRTDRYHAVLGDLRRRGISFSLNFIFGWDTETREVFPNTLRFLEDEKVPVAYFNLLTPEKGTSFYDRMRQQDRIINEKEIGRWPGQPCHIKPLYCSPRELEQAVQGIHRRFYSLPSMLRRLPMPLSTPAIASWALNLSQRRVSAHPDNQNHFSSY
ncbi:MAG TPA: B12-binding domain-containing radical SAM protein [Candidatus Acidoferrum sp.]|nr:B12-binding domain-containing radical SAM protein [Candidatus Acidoferrum sp.]